GPAVDTERDRRPLGGLPERQGRCGGDVEAATRGGPEAASATATATATEEPSEDVLEATTTTLGVAHSGTATTSGCAATEQTAEDVLEAARARGCVEPGPSREGAHLVVLLALLRVGEHGVGLADLLEA